MFVIPERTPEPAFTLPELNGRTLSSKDFVGKVAVLSFGTTWCASCVSELKSLERLQRLSYCGSGAVRTAETWDRQRFSV